MAKKPSLSKLFLTYDKLKAGSAEFRRGNGLVEGDLDESGVERSHQPPADLRQEEDQEDVAGRHRDTRDQSHPRSRIVKGL